jgi:PKD repeat protein
MPDPATKRGGACHKPPKLSLTVATSATAGEPVAILGSVQPGTGQPGCAIVAWSLDFGDGAALAGTNAGTITTRHNYGASGTYLIELMAESESGPSATPVEARIRVEAAAVVEPPIPPVIEPPIEPEPPSGSVWVMSSTTILFSDTACQWSAH